jgi:hypothetical protein
MQFHDITQNSDEWMALRLGKATSSRFSCFMANEGKGFGDPAKRYALQLALERITGRKSEYSFKNDDMDRGNEQEPAARMLYEEYTFVEVSNGGFFDCGQYGDSPDGLVGENGIIEIKSVIAPTHYATFRRNSFDPSYRWQLIGHLDCTGRDWVDFVSYCGEFPEDQQLFVHRLHRSDYTAEIETLRHRRAEFLALVEHTHRDIQQKAA